MSISKLGKGDTIRRLAKTITGGSPDRVEAVVNSDQPGTAVPASSPDYVNPGSETLVYRQFNSSSSINFPSANTSLGSFNNFNPVHSRSINGYSAVNELSVGAYIVAGGGSSSGFKRTGGGGAGGVHFIPHADSLSDGAMRLSLDTTYPFSVGGGGGNTTFNGYTSTRGGVGGAGDNGPYPGRPGGCGGGSATNDGRTGSGGAATAATNNRGVPNDPTMQGYAGSPSVNPSNGGASGGSAAQAGSKTSGWNPGISAYGIPIAIGGGGGPSGGGGNGSNPARGSGRQGAGDGTSASGAGTGGTVIISFLRANS